MSKVVARTIFSTTIAERSWKNYATSGIVHTVVIAAAFLIVIPTVQHVQRQMEQHVTLVAPVIPRYHSKIEPPRVQHVAKLVMPAPLPDAKTITPPVVPPPLPKPIVKDTPPPVMPKPAAPVPQILADIKPALPPPPKPVVKMGSFEDSQLAKAASLQKQVVVGGFGDPRGVQAADNPKPSPVLMARVGSFESPVGSGQAGGGGRLDSGGVKQSGFGNTGLPNNSAAGRAPATVRTGNFGDGAVGGVQNGSGHAAVKSTGFGDTIAAAPQHKEAVASVPAFTPVEILFKPRPSYSAEARDLHLEGQVSLEVVFQASGAVKVVRVIKGLGHGLDEAAEQAALRVRFKPAMRGGAPIDQPATISITFELT